MYLQSRNYISVLHMKIKFMFSRASERAVARSNARSEVHRKRDGNCYIRVHKNSGLCSVDGLISLKMPWRKLNSWHPRNFYGRIKNTSSVVPARNKVNEDRRGRGGRYSANREREREERGDRERINERDEDEELRMSQWDICGSPGG